MTDEARICPGRNCDSKLRHNEHLCRRCVNRAERAVADLPALLAELDKTIARQTSGSGSGTLVSGGESRVPINLGAMEKRNLAGHLAALACDVGYWLPTFDLPGIVYAVLCDPSKLQYRPDGPVLAKAIHRTVAEWRGVIDASVDSVFAGRCGGCDAQMFARPSQPKFRCPKCDMEYETESALTLVEDLIRDTLWPIKLIQQAYASRLGTKVTADVVRQWRKRGQLVARGLDIDGAETYRVGDYLDLAAALAERRASGDGRATTRSTASDTPR